MNYFKSTNAPANNQMTVVIAAASTILGALGVVALYYWLSKGKKQEQSPDGKPQKHSVDTPQSDTSATSQKSTAVSVTNDVAATTTTTVSDTNASNDQNVAKVVESAPDAESSPRPDTPLDDSSFERIAHILISGLTGSGKSTVLTGLSANQDNGVIRVDTTYVSYRIHKVGETVSDMPIDIEYSAVVYVVDSTNTIEQTEAAVEHLKKLLKAPQLAEDTPLLLIANKQDDPSAISPVLLRSKFSFIRALSRKVRLIGCSSKLAARAACQKAMFDMADH